MSDLLGVLRERGFVQDISDEPELRKRLESGPITLYNGIDATAESLTIGHLYSIMAMAWYQRFGHRPIALLGGGTTMVGDPSGRQTTRPILSKADIDRNIAGIRYQVERFLDFSEGRALLLNNADWLLHLNFLEFMRDIGSRFSINEVLRLEAYRTRIEAGGATFLELNYVLLQSYDFLRLYEDHNCILQIGGSDQWGNCVMGADLIRRVTGGQAYVVVSPLLADPSGKKMGKTTGNAVWLKSSPYDYYQYWRNVEDNRVERLLAVYTFLPMDEVRTLTSGHGAELNRAKEVLAFEATRLLHGEEAAREAQEAARALFGGGGDAAQIPTLEIDRAQFDEGLSLMNLFKQAGLVKSGNEARTQIKQGGLSVNGERVTDLNARIGVSDVPDDGLMLRRGRKEHRRVILSR